MDKKSKILLWIFAGALIISVGVTYYRYVVKRDYIIFAHTECDPKTESCFYTPCEDGAENDCGAEIEYYKKINKKAFNIELCDIEQPDCKPLVCKDGEKDCEIISCSDATLGEGESCSTPPVEATTTEATSTVKN